MKEAYLALINPEFHKYKFILVLILLVACETQDFIKQAFLLWPQGLDHWVLYGKHLPSLKSAFVFKQT